MTNAQQGTEQASDVEQMQRVRRLVLGDNHEVVTQTVTDNARSIVKTVVSEALHDRESQDGSVNKVLVPLVEKSVETSIANHSEQYVGYLYPLVGSLVRKSVTAFITDILEKTNALIENSLTAKGLSWRFKAWQAGISFSQYVVSQTFDFRVEQVFLIHKETGILLNSVSQDINAGADADMVSAMLTAINDFVADSFKPNADSTEQSLDVIRTDDFTLIIKPGPKAIVVAAVTGNTPQQVADRLQLTLEDIHHLHDQDLSAFEGDIGVFENCEIQLRECLISQLKAEQQVEQKRPWFGWLLFLMVLLGLGYLGTVRFQAHQTIDKLQNLSLEPGIMVTQLELSGLNHIHLKLLRDPAAVEPEQWLTTHQIDAENLSINQRAYLSLDPALIQQKTAAIIAKYPQLSMSWQQLTPIITGTLSSLEKLNLQHQLRAIAGLNYQPSWLAALNIHDLAQQGADDPAITRAILDLHIAKIDNISVSFEKGKSELSSGAVGQLLSIAQQFNRLIKLAEQQNLSLGLIIMGATDASGSAAYNRRLSQTRANAVKQKLQELGVDGNRLNAIGLGRIELPSAQQGARKVIFNVVYFAANE